MESFPLLHDPATVVKQAKIIRYLLAIGCIIACIISWVAMAELIQGLESGSTKLKAPWLIAYIIHSSYVVFLIPVGIWQLVRPVQEFRASKPVILHSMWISAIAFACVYVWYRSLPMTTVEVNTAIYNSSAVPVYIFGILLLKERVSIPKLFSVVVCISGVAVIALFAKSSSTSESESVHNSLLGCVLVVASTILYGAYEVLFKRFGVTEEQKSPVFTSLLFLGSIGLWTLLFMWPGLLLMWGMKWEDYTVLDAHILGDILLNAALDCAFNCFLLIGIALTNPLLMTIGTLLSIPVGMATDYFVNKFVMSNYGYLGVGLLMVGFICLNVAEFREHSKEKKKNAKQIQEEEERIFQ